ncbi:MAG TPA: hypothetical protein VIL69_17825 [Roseomonas sp.]
MEQFTTMVAAIAEAAAQSQLGRSLFVTEEPRDVSFLDMNADDEPQTVTGHFAVMMEETPGSMTATLSPNDDPDIFDVQLVIALQGSDEQVVFTAAVEDSMGLANTYQALLDAKHDPSADPDIQNTVV